MLTDVLSIPKTNEFFRLLYDVKGRFLLHRIQQQEAEFKLGKVVRVALGAKSIPYCVTHDGRTFRFPDPKIAVNDTVRINLKSKKIVNFVKFEAGNVCMITGGRNAGRIGIIVNKEKHPGSHEIVHIRDSNGAAFATRSNYVFVIGKGSEPWISIPHSAGLKVNKIEDRKNRLELNEKNRKAKVVKEKAAKN